MTTLTRALRRQTVGTLDGSFCSDRNKRLVISLEPGDLITIRPAKTRRAESIAITDVYRYAIRCRIGRAQLEKAREKQAKDKTRKADAAWKRSISRSKLSPS